MAPAATLAVSIRTQSPILVPRRMEYSRPRFQISREAEQMGGFLFGFLCGVGATVFIFMYDEGEMFLKLAHRVKEVASRYRQQGI